MSGIIESFFAVSETDIEERQRDDDYDNNNYHIILLQSSRHILRRIVADILFHAGIGIDRIERFSDSVRKRRNDDGDNARTCGAKKPCDGEHNAALIGVGRHRRCQAPIRNVDCRIRHGPEHIEHRNYGDRLPAVNGITERHTPKVVRQEAHNGQNGDRERSKQNIRSALAPLAVRMVNYRTHYRVVQRVVQTSAEHDKTDCRGSYHQTVGQIVSQIGAYYCGNKVLSETAERIA